MPLESNLSASDFWSLYFERRLIQLQRHADGRVSGIYLDFGEDGEAWVGGEQEFAIERRTLAEYDTAPDSRFAAGPCRDLSRALSAVIQTDAFKEETVPNRRQLFLIIRLLRDPRPMLLSDVHRIQTRQALDRFQKKELAQPELMTTLQGLVPGRDNGFQALSNVLLKMLVQERVSAEDAADLLGANEQPAGLSYRLFWTLALRALDAAQTTVDRACRWLEFLKPTLNQYKEYEEGGELAAIHTERDVLYLALALCPTRPAIGAVLLDALKNHAHDDLFVVVSIIRALGIHNEKSAIGPLIEFLAAPAMKSYREEIELALQKLCSGNRLFARAVFAEPVKTYTEEELEAANADPNFDPLLEFDYWRHHQKSLPATSSDWFIHDLNSVFWEKRLRCALAAGQMQVSAHYLSPLATDEVAAVRAAAPKPA